MSNYEAFDDNIKEQFGDYSPEVHPRIWENIIKERKKRKPVGFWFTFFNGRNILMLTALIVTSSTGAWLLLQKTTGKKDNIQVQSGQKNTTTATAAIDEKNTIGRQQQAELDKQPDIASKNIAINNDANNSSNIDNTTTATGSFKIKTFAPFTADENEALVNTKTKKTAAIKNNYEEAATDEITYDNNSNDNFLKYILFTGLQKITTEKKAITLNNRKVPNIFLPGCPAIEKNAAGNKSYIELYVGPDLGIRNITDTGNSAYLQKRKESTKFSSAYSAGLRYTHVFGNGMSVRTGINYSQINEKFTFVQGNLVQVTYIINAAGDTTGSYTTTGTRYKTTHNKFRTIDVPLLIGYEMGNGKFHANVNAGIIVNAYSWQKGEVLDTALNPVTITTGKTTSPYQFKTNIGLGFTAGVSMYYKLNEKVHLLAEPYFRYNLSPMSKEKLTLTQKYNTAGLKVGLRVDLH